MILNIPGVIHLFVALLGPILGVLLGILVSPKTLMEILIGGVSEPLNLFPQFLRGERKHPVPGLQAMAVETYSPIEDLDKQVPILVFIKLDFPRVFSEFHLGKRRGGALLKCLPDRKPVGRGVEAIDFRPPGLDLFFGLSIPKGGGGFRGDLVKNQIFQLGTGKFFA